jgi:hypothetical protein
MNGDASVSPAWRFAGRLGVGGLCTRYPCFRLPANDQSCSAQCEGVAFIGRQRRRRCGALPGSDREGVPAHRRMWAGGDEV